MCVLVFYIIIAIIIIWQNKKVNSVGKEETMALLSVTEHKWENRIYFTDVLLILKIDK